VLEQWTFGPIAAAVEVAAAAVVAELGPLQGNCVAKYLTCFGLPTLRAPLHFCAQERKKKKKKTIVLKNKNQVNKKNTVIIKSSNQSDSVLETEHQIKIDTSKDGWLRTRIQSNHDEPLPLMLTMLGRQQRLDESSQNSRIDWHCCYAGSRYYVT
jgi:hypothetical protein